MHTVYPYICYKISEFYMLCSVDFVVLLGTAVFYLLVSSVVLRDVYCAQIDKNLYLWMDVIP